ncbi:hypothetical protein MMC07_007775 [Pseudocyphellaria aurata]|nr:hypothetical protein [Pseudocyphellaria aurata]
MVQHTVQHTQGVRKQIVAEEEKQHREEATQEKEEKVRLEREQELRPSKFTTASEMNSDKSIPCLLPSYAEVADDLDVGL